MKDNRLIIGDMLAGKLAKQHETPVYVYDSQKIKEKARFTREIFDSFDCTLHYAVKANSHPDVIQTLYNQGIEMEVGSLAELKLCRQLGISQDDLMYTASFVSENEIKKVVSAGVQVNADSLQQLHWIGKSFKGASVGLRINTGAGAGHHEYVQTAGENSKFGIHPNYIVKAKRIAETYSLQITGLHHHIGSQILEKDIIKESSLTLAHFAEQFPELKYLNLGGGFGVPYRPNQRQLDISKLADSLREVVGRSVPQGNIKIQVEPGRYFVANAGYLLVSVTDIKKTPNRTFVGVDSGMNHLLRPALYNTYHHIINVDNVYPKFTSSVDVVGNICESGDVFAKQREISPVNIGDTLAICSAGAYGYTMASKYNSRSLPKEVIV